MDLTVSYPVYLRSVLKTFDKTLEMFKKAIDNGLVMREFKRVNITRVPKIENRETALSLVILKVWSAN